MDHKEFFEKFGKQHIQIGPFGYLNYTAEQLYQAIKQRLIEELITEDRIIKHGDGYSSGTISAPGYRLIDTTESKDG